MPARRDQDVRDTIATVWRAEAARLIGGLTRLVRDFGLAEDLAHDALVAALQEWPVTGVPDNPAAWLAAAARHRAIDLLRRQQVHERKLAELGRDLSMYPSVELDEAVLTDDFDDDLLRLLFMACHPVLPAASQLALTLRALCGLRTEEIARAFLVAESAIAQRIVRAKRTLRQAKARFELPAGPERTARLAAVLEVLYLMFNEGYSSTSGEDLFRPDLCGEALRLCRLLAEVTPDEAEVHGLLALMEIQQSRAATRTGPAGEPVPLLEQDRSRWDHAQIQRGLAALDRADQLSPLSGPYALQAAIAACHARAVTPEQTDWVRMATLYTRLSELTASPVVELNRAVAIAMAYGPAAGLALLDRLSDEPALRQYHHLPSVRGDLLARLGHLDQARAEFTRAAALTRNQRERAVLLARADACAAE